MKNGVVTDILLVWLLFNFLDTVCYSVVDAFNTFGKIRCLIVDFLPTILFVVSLHVIGFKV